VIRGLAMPEEAVKVQSDLKNRRADVADKSKEAMIGVLGQDAYDQYLKALQGKPSAMQRQAEFGLVDAEIVAIRAYTDSHYDDLNRMLRGNKTGIDSLKANRLSIFADTLSSGINKLPSTEGVMRRDVRLSQSMLDQFQERIGKKVRFTAFTSSANTLRQVMDGKFNCRMELSSMHGKSIVDFSVHGRKEAEVIFDRGTEFVIKSVVQDRKKKSVTVILLDESTEIR